MARTMGWVGAPLDRGRSEMMVRVLAAEAVAGGLRKVEAAARAAAAQTMRIRPSARARSQRRRVGGMAGRIIDREEDLTPCPLSRSKRGFGRGADCTRGAWRDGRTVRTRTSGEGRTILMSA